ISRHLACAIAIIFAVIWTWRRPPTAALSHSSRGPKSVHLRFPGGFSRTAIFLCRGLRANQLELTTAWRNSRDILDMANHVAQPLRDETTDGQLIPQLQARSGAEAGTVELNWFESADNEAAHLAERITQLG